MSTIGGIGFAGLSHLGIIYSAATAARGFPVVAFDPRVAWVEQLNRGDFPVKEPGLELLVQKHAGLIRYSSDAASLAQCKLVFVALDVTTDDKNNSDLAPLKSLISGLATCAMQGTTIVLMSQVPPGFCRKLASTLRPDLILFYQVETLIFGNAVERAIRPERYMVGSADPGIPFPDGYRAFLEAFECPVLHMQYESAELCKIAINCFLVSSVTTANTLAELCEGIGATWSEIIPALQLDRRIGPFAYLKPGLGISGGNLERDLATVQRLAAENGCDGRVVASWQQHSAYVRNWVLRRLHRLAVIKDPRTNIFAMWGLAYKADTHSTKNSPALDLLRALGDFIWKTYDPVAKLDVTGFVRVRSCRSPLDALEGAAALIVMTPWKDFSQISPEAIRKRLRSGPVIDPYGALNKDDIRRVGLDYHSIGA